MNGKYFSTIKERLFLSLTAVLVAHNAFDLPLRQQNFAAVAQTSTLSPNNDLVTFTVTVLSERDKRSIYVTGLQQSDFTVFSDGAQQEIAYFSNKDQPASIAILVDTSGSMMPRQTSVSRLSFIDEAFTNLIRLSNSENEYLLLSVNQSSRLLLEWTRDTNAVLTELARLTSEKPKGPTALYEACYLGIEKLKTSKHAKRMILLISDGQDNSSQSPYNRGNLRRLLRETNVLFYAINVDGLQRLHGDFDPLGEQGHQFLTEMAKTSGGIAFYPRREAVLKDIFDFIALELRHQYLIGFKAPNLQGDDKWRRIKIKIASAPDTPRELKRLYVRHREGYFASSSRR